MVYVNFSALPSISQKVWKIYVKGKKHGILIFLVFDFYPDEIKSDFITS